MKAQILLLCYLLNMDEHPDLLSGNMKQAPHSWALSAGFRKCVCSLTSDCLRELGAFEEGGLN